MKKTHRYLLHCCLILVAAFLIGRYPSNIFANEFPLPTKPDIDFNTPLYLKADGTLWTFDYDDDSSKRQAQKIMENVAEISAFRSYTMTLVLKKDGTVWVLDRSKSIPYQVLDNTISIQSGYDYGLNAALKKDGTLWVWGSYTGFKTPTQIQTGIVSVKIIDHSIFYLKADKSLWHMRSIYFTNDIPSGDIKHLFPAKIGEKISSYDIVDGMAYFINDSKELWYMNIYSLYREPTYIELAKLPAAYKITDHVVQISHPFILKEDGTALSLGNHFTSYQTEGLTKLTSNVESILDSSGPVFIKTDGSVWTYLEEDETFTYTNQPLVNFGNNIEQLIFSFYEGSIILKDGSLWFLGNAEELRSRGLTPSIIPGVSLPYKPGSVYGEVLGYKIFDDFLAPSTKGPTIPALHPDYALLPLFITNQLLEGYELGSMNQDFYGNFMIELRNNLPDDKGDLSRWCYDLSGKNESINRCDFSFSLSAAKGSKDSIESFYKALTYAEAYLSKLTGTSIPFTSQEKEQMSKAIMLSEPYKNESKNYTIEMPVKGYSHSVTLSILLKDNLHINTKGKMLALPGEQVDTAILKQLGFSSSEMHKQIEDWFPSNRFLRMSATKNVLSTKGLQLNAFEICTIIDKTILTHNTWTPTCRSYSATWILDADTYLNQTDKIITEIKNWTNKSHTVTHFKSKEKDLEIALQHLRNWRNSPYLHSTQLTNITDDCEYHVLCEPINNTSQLKIMLSWGEDLPSPSNNP